ncbi:MAG TPA: PEFG-CTERM sorting domain-containing protein [Candidatus Nitrosotalea sp.]|nr:PEFG-CTERM sorting domain-containing protein [Candidatus Nitrosotalea sp.]
MHKFAIAFLIILFGLPLAGAFADSTGFTAPVIVSSPGGNSTIPQLVVSGNNVYLGWVDRTAGQFGAKIAHSSDGGASFGHEVNLGSIGGAIDNIRIAGSGGAVVAVWQSFSANKSSIAFAKSTDNGTTFGPPVQISNSTRDSAFPQVAVSGSHVYVAWLDRTEGDITNVVFAKSDDGGTTFGTPVSITSHAGTSGIPKIYADGSNVYLLWEDNGEKNFEIFLASSSNSGNTFDLPVNISNDAGNSGTPQMSVSGKNIYVVWMDDSSGHYAVMLSRSTDGAQTFSNPVDLSQSKQDSGYPQIASDGSNVYVAWTGTITEKNYDVYFTKSTDGGQTFGQPLDISNSPGASGWPQVAATGNVYVSWVDNSPGPYDVYITKSTDGGASFGQPVDVSNSVGGTWYNQMVATPNTVYLSWLGVGQNNSQITFSKSTTFVPEFGGVASIVLVLSIISVVVLSRRYGQLHFW